MTNAKIDELVKMKEEQIEDIEEKIDELELIQSHENMKIVSYNAFMELHITTEEMTNEVCDALDFSIVEGPSISNRGDKLKIVADIDADFSAFEIEQAEKANDTN